VNPQQLIERLEQVDQDLAERQNQVEDLAVRWFRAKRDREKAYAIAFLSADGTAGERDAHAKLAAHTVDDGSIEGEWEGAKAAVRALETRASVGQTLVRSNVRLSS